MSIATARAAAAPDEAQLAAAVARGDLRAFEVLYRLYRPRLARFLERMTRRPALVEELLDDTLLFVWHHAARFDGTSRLSSWIFGVAYRKALKALGRVDEPAPDDGRDQRADDAAAGPEQRFGHEQRRAALLHALDGLSPEHRAVVVLTYFHGLGYREIAAIVQCPHDTVKTRMFHARRQLRRLLPGGAEAWL